MFKMVKVESKNDRKNDDSRLCFVVFSAYIEIWLAVGYLEIDLNSHFSFLDTKPKKNKKHQPSSNGCGSFGIKVRS